MIAGAPGHPGTLAIAGRRKAPVVFFGEKDFEKWLKEEKNRIDLHFVFVSPTTSAKKIWDNCVKKAKKLCTNAEFFDTICGATSKRQEEARRLAAERGLVVEVDDRQSSNTKRLREICR